MGASVQWTLYTVSRGVYPRALAMTVAMVGREFVGGENGVFETISVR